jgi:anti-sigma regulatory factor (Ser/Thr protein kinase)
LRLTQAQTSKRVRRSPAPDARFAVRLSPTWTAVREARRIVARQLAQHIGEETLDDVLLVVSELVTNAVLHGRGDVDLRMELDRGRITGAVSDEGHGFTPRRRRPDPSRVGGHGLHIVARVADRWGLTAGTTHVWFEIPVRR